MQGGRALSAWWKLEEGGLEWSWLLSILWGKYLGTETERILGVCGRLSEVGGARRELRGKERSAGGTGGTEAQGLCQPHLYQIK